ncbi:CRAL-TRIO domain containing protein [Oryctes borbonicus]|uniref:CRAL-TRIO domain containing protein n=1 Tax=Oryctes borbonicus TaxID=1629725 RepID=A0A0T6B7A9_9SCAR|nr:CRAL-TRIO domain containing protein [Oryctes borbonicus]
METGYVVSRYTFNSIIANNFLAVELVITLLQNYEANYPEILKICYIINAPKLFALAYAVVKKFINEYTQSKIKIYKQESTKWRTLLLEHVSPDNLPKHYGGTMVDPDGDPKCPSKVRPGKTVPKELYKKNLTDEVLVNRDYVTTTIKKGKQLTLDFFISDPGSLLQWDFRTEDHDIRFGVTYTDENGNVHNVITPSRTSANLVDVTGTITCKAPATYTVIFDNSYSRFRSKTLHYYVVVVEHLNKLDIESSPEARTNESEANVVDRVVVH